MRNKITAIVFFLFSLNFGFSQVKYEKEYSIDLSEVPEIALDKINEFFPDSKVKWIKEESQDGITIEAKTKYQKHYYSIEFDTLGNLLDIEKTIKFNELNSKAKKQISSSLKAKFGKFKIHKLQIHFSAESHDFKKILNNDFSDLDFKYEIILEAKENNTPKLFEVLMRKNGEIEKSLIIERRNTDNLEF